MKALIIYNSVHHGNTEKIAKAMANALDAKLSKPGEVDASSLEQYELIGFGSGIYGFRFHKSILEFVESLPSSKNKKAFVFSTSGSGREQYNESLKKKLAEKGFDIAGDFSCKGFNTFGPLKLIGGISKGRPNEEDIRQAVKFAESMKS